jgi:hypothetical protein
MTDEWDNLRAMLGLPSEPPLLDIKPPDLLTAAERELFTRRLAELESTRQKDHSAAVLSWRRFWQIGRRTL